MNSDAIGRQARATQPYIEQIFLCPAPEMTQDELERRLYVIRKRAENELGEQRIFLHPVDVVTDHRI